MTDLNPQQEEAVRAADGPCVILAGPGTGKTRTLTRRLAYLINDQHVPPADVLAVTFTRAAAREMAERLRALLPGRPLDSLWVETFHAAARRILREQSYPFGPDIPFSVAADDEKQSCLEGLIAPKDRSAFLENLRQEKERLRLPIDPGVAAYQERLLAARRLDFDDLLLYACRLLDERPDVRDRYRRKFRYILVDEFQDTRFAQYELLRRLAGEHVCVAGDPDQSIYGFAGEPFHPFERFAAEYPHRRILPLTENHRSQASILEAAQQVIGRNPAALPRTLQPRLEKGLPVEVAAHRTPRQEAEMIVRRIEGLLGGASQFTVDSGWAEKEAESRSYGLGDIAVLYRLHAQARAIEEALVRAGLPCRVFGKELRQDGQEVPAGGWEDFLKTEEAAPSVPGRGERVTLMTLHRAKGLEFPVVFLAGCETGLLPYSGPAHHGGPDEAEERRLFYVGMTRAKNRLFLSYAEKRTLFGRTGGGPSSFLGDIQTELRRLRAGDPPAKKTKSVQSTLFDLS